VLCMLTTLPSAYVLGAGPYGNFYATGAIWLLKPSSWSLLARALTAVSKVDGLGSLLYTLWSFLGFIWSSVTWSLGQALMILVGLFCVLLAFVDVSSEGGQQGGQRRAAGGQGRAGGPRGAQSRARAGPRDSRAFPEGFGPLALPPGCTHSEVIAVLQADNYYEVS
jgi:hypothetical protein